MPYSDPDTGGTPKEPPGTTAHRLDSAALGAADLDVEHPAAGHRAAPPAARPRSMQPAAALDATDLDATDLDAEPHRPELAAVHGADLDATALDAEPPAPGAVRRRPSSRPAPAGGTRRGGRRAASAWMPPTWMPPACYARSIEPQAIEPPSASRWSSPRRTPSSARKPRPLHTASRYTPSSPPTWMPYFG